MSIGNAGTALSIDCVMESPAAESLGWSLDDSAKCWTVAPGQQRLIERNETMIDALLAAISEAEQGEVIVASSTIWNAKRLLQLLPAEIPATDAYISDRESICFDWDEDPNAQFSLMVQRDSQIAFAAYFGKGGRFNGAVAFNPAELPEELAAILKKWQRHTAAC